jgi:hypothetical protein
MWCDGAVKKEILQGLVPCLTQPPEHENPAQNADKSKEADLSIVQGQQLGHFLAPPVR